MRIATWNLEGKWTQRHQLDPHGATALAEVGGLRVASSVLPWKGCGGGEPWCGLDMGTRTTAAVDDVEATAPSIWGGDWNHELTGRLYTGSVVGRARILAALDGSCPTEGAGMSGAGYE